MVKGCVKKIAGKVVETGAEDVFHKIFNFYPKAKLIHCTCLKEKNLSSSSARKQICTIFPSHVKSCYHLFQIAIWYQEVYF